MRLRICLGLVLSLSVANIGRAKEELRTGPRAPGKLLKQADKLIGERRIDEALTILEPASKVYPEDAELLLRLGNCYSLKAEYEKSQVSFEAGLQAHPDEPRLLHNLGLLFFKQQQYDRALSYFLRTVQVRYWHPDANFYIARIYENRGEREEALHHYIQELNHNPSNLKALERMRRLQSELQESRASKFPLAILLAVWLLMLLGLLLFQWKLRRPGAGRLAVKRTENAGRR